MSFLTAMAPGSEIYMFVGGLVILLLGVASVVYGLITAQRARAHKAGANRFAVKSRAFYWTFQGLLGGIIGGLPVVANFVNNSAAAAYVTMIIFFIVLVVVVAMIWRYMVAERRATEARAFDHAMWRFFNG